MNDRNIVIMNRAKSGETYADIARDYGLTRERIRQIAKAAGIPAKPRRVLSASERRAILKRVDAGDKYRAIAADFSLQNSSISYIARQAGYLRNAGKDQADALRLISIEGRKKGLTAQEIANRTGMTRNAVIGYWHRAKRDGLL